MSVTHIAGPRIRIGERQIQRCSVCGEKLVDNLEILQGLCVEMTEDGPRRPEAKFWPVGEPIKHEGNSWRVLSHESGDSLPDDCCIDLVE